MKFNGKKEIKNDVKIQIYEEDKFKDIYNQLIKKYGDKFKDLRLYMSCGKGYTNTMVLYRNTCLSNRENLKELYTIFKENGVNFRYDIIDLITILGQLEDPNKNKEVIDAFINSPFIDDVSFNGKDRFHIASKRLGDIDVEVLRKRYENCKKLINYLNMRNANNHCHQNAELMATLYKEMYTITSKIPDYFYKGYYHSYTYNKEDDEIINLGENSIISKEDYDRIYLPKEIYRVSNEDLKEEIRKADSECNINKSTYPVLRLALYKEHTKTR